ncbi:protein NDNF-like [Myxocyprinus asiaticus]|uniref:protein NDNF-like n=1 Tax=Myxocyprinus asiaticus TaxID=70543 RepID=UPI0022223F23|nr:protein NDNF-like [Myxocyprinus asiaticus]
MMTLYWCFCLAVALFSVPGAIIALAPENEVPLHPTTWLGENKVTSVHLPKGRARRLYFTLKKRADLMFVTVSPCAVPIEWSLAVRTLKDKPPKKPHWSSKKSMPEVWWRGSGREVRIYTYTGNAVDTYTGPAYAPASIYILRLKSNEQDTQVSAYLHEGPGPSGAFPELPSDPRVHTLGVGMTSVTLSWSPSSSVVVKNGHDGNQPYQEYCVLINHKHNYRSLCAARDGIRKERQNVQKRERREKQGKEIVWATLKDWWWQQPDALEDHESSLWDNFEDPGCVCRDVESVCTVSDLLPDTQYYFDVFVVDRVNGTSAAYTGTFARTHEEARPAVTSLREGQVKWVTLSGDASSQQGEKLFQFKPRGWQQNGLLTLHTCNGTSKVKVTVSSKGRVLSSEEVGHQLAQIWLHGGPSYLIQLQALVPGSSSSSVSKDDSSKSKFSLKMQASSAYHRRAVPVFPATLQMKSFNKLRTCNSVTIAWMGTEERSLYCVYRRQIPLDSKDKHSSTDRCTDPESRPAKERVLCKYFQELNPRRAVTTAVIGGLDPGVAYVFDVYLMRRWGLPIKYHSKMVRTRSEC